MVDGPLAAITNALDDLTADGQANRSPADQGRLLAQCQRCSMFNRDDPPGCQPRPAWFRWILDTGGTCARNAPH